MRTRFIVRAGVFEGRLRFYVYDQLERRQCTSPTFDRANAVNQAALLRASVNGEILKGPGIGA